MKAVVMAGGEGSRLRPITVGRPKPMVPVVNKPIMQHVLELLRRHKFTDIVVTLQYMAEYIQSFFGNGQSYGVNLQYSVEETPLGTAGSVRNAQHLLDLHEPFLVMSADALTDFDLRAVVRFHRQSKALVTIVLHRVPNPLEYGVIVTDNDGRVTRFHEKPSWGEVVSDTVNTGIYVFDPEILQEIEPGQVVDWSRDVFPRLLEAGAPIFGYVAENYWCDIGNLDEYRRAVSDVLHGKVNLGPLGHRLGGDVWTGDGVEIASDAQLLGPIYLGNEVKVKSGAIIHGPTFVRDYAIIDSHAHVDRSMIWRNCYIGESAELRGAIICRQSVVKSKAVLYEGSVLGDNCVIGPGAVIHSNVKLWPSKEVEAGATVKSSIIWGSQGRRVLFGRFGVTGVINVDLTPEFSARLGAAFGASLPRGSSVTINRDLHRSPRMLKRAIISGLPSAGINVWDLGTVPIPVARYFTRVTNASGGVHVKISPYDSRVVDIRFMDNKGLDLSKEHERSIEQIFFREDFRRADVDDIGFIEYPSGVVDSYMTGFLAALNVDVIRSQRFKIVLDYAHAPTAEVLPALLGKLNVDVVPLNARLDATRVSAHSGDFDANLRQLAIISGALGTNLGIQLDVGGEKIFLTDNDGHTISNTATTMLLVTLALQHNHGGVVALPSDASLIFETLAAQYSGRVTRCRSDLHALMLASQEKNVVFAADGTGGFIFPTFQPVSDGLMAVAKLLELLAEHTEKLSDLLDSLPDVYMESTRVGCPWEIKGAVMRRLMSKYQGDESQDGIRIGFDEREWVLIRPDPDESNFLITAEAKSSDRLTQILERYQREVARLRDLTE